MQFKKGDLVIYPDNGLTVEFSELSGTNKFSGTIVDKGRSSWHNGEYSKTWTLDVFKLHKKGGNMKAKTKELATNLYKKVKPFEKYILIGAIIFLIDHFVLDGKIVSSIKEESSKITKLAKKLVSKFTDKVDSLIDSL